MSNEQYNLQDELERATSRRLARLGAMPVDTAGLERMLQGKLPDPPRAMHLPMWLRPLRAVAAILAVALLIAGVLVFSSSGPVLASPSLMAQMHRDLVAERVPVMKVDSIDEACQVLSKHLDDATLPQAPDAHVMACCMREVKDKKVACVLLRSGNVPVTLTVARAADMKLPTSPTVVRDGVTYHVQKIEDLTMVMTERQGRWVCLISELPADAIMEIAGKLQF